MKAPLGREQTMSRDDQGRLVHHVLELPGRQALRQGVEFSTSVQRYVFHDAIELGVRGLQIRAYPIDRPDLTVTMDPERVETVHRTTTQEAS